MAGKSLFDTLLRSLGLSEAKPGKPGHGRGGGSEHAVDTTFRDFEARIDKALGARTRAIGDRVYLISFDKVRAALGERWTKAGDTIHALIERVLEHRLVGHDLFIRYGEASYLVVFSILGPKEAQLKCARIAEDVLKRLVGTGEVAKYIDVRSVHAGEAGAMRFQDLPPAETLAGEVVRRLDDIPEPASPSPAARDSGDDPAAPAWEPVRPPAPAASAAVQGPEALGVEFIFRPLLTVRTKVVSTFLCFPVLPRRGGGYESGYDVLSDPHSPAQVCELDLLTLKRVAAELPRMGDRNARSLLGLPVHYETLANPRSGAAYLKRCAQVLAGRESRIVFELIGLPFGAPQGRVLELHSLLRRHARAVIMRVPLVTADFNAFKAAGVHAAGVDVYAVAEREKTLMADLDTFVRRAKAAQLRTYVHGVRTISLYTAAVCSGFDYLAGYALTSVAEVPQDAYAFRPDMPYLSLLGKDGDKAGG